MYIRRKTVRGKDYYQMVEGYRDDAGKVRHRTIISLGRSATLVDANEALKRNITRTRRELSRLKRQYAATYNFPAEDPIYKNLAKVWKRDAARIARVERWLTQQTEKLASVEAVAKKHLR